MIVPARLSVVEWIVLFLLTTLSSSSSTIVSAAAPNRNIPRLNPRHLRKTRGGSDYNTVGASSSSSSEADFRTFYYNQTLDHFNYRPESYATFKQRVVISSKYWGGAKANAPIFAYLGEEASIDWDINGIGFLNENAPRFKALIIFIEHRFYGESVPFGTPQEEAMKNESTRGYFNSAQAIADYAEVLLHVKKKFSAQKSPVIVIGGSYGGMLASWFRLKYPHIALGALASSAPILYFDDITPHDGYYSVVTKDFKEVSETCYETIRESWSEIDRVSSSTNGLSILSQRFKTCTPLNTSLELMNYLDWIYNSAAQYNAPPNYPVTQVCGGINGAPPGTDILGRIFAGVVAYHGNYSCYDTKDNNPSETIVGWGWQVCSEMVIPIGGGMNSTMFPWAPFNLRHFIDHCKKSYGVLPRPHWVTTYYGGHDIKLVLNKFASNIIFSNGLRDPYSIGGVLEDISESVLAVYTTNGSHCLDILPAEETDPQWLVEQRKREVEIIDGWIKKYYDDLLAFSR